MESWHELPPEAALGNLRVISAPQCADICNDHTSCSALLAGRLAGAANAGICALPHTLNVTLRILVRTFSVHHTSCKARQHIVAAICLASTLGTPLHLPPHDKLYKGSGKDADHRCRKHAPPFTDLRFSKLKILSSDAAVLGLKETW